MCQSVYGWNTRIYITAYMSKHVARNQLKLLKGFNQRYTTMSRKHKAIKNAEYPATLIFACHLINGATEWDTCKWGGLNLRSTLTSLGTSVGWVLRHCLHGHGFICNRIAFDTVTAFVYTAPIETTTEGHSILYPHPPCWRGKSKFTP